MRIPFKLLLSFSPIVAFLAIGLTGCATRCQDVLTSRPQILEPGQSVDVPVSSFRYWNATGVRLSRGADYDLTVNGDQRWWDAWVKSSAAGYAGPWLRWAECFRRVSDANWFALIGTNSSDCEHTFTIGDHCVYHASEDGELLCFANDAWLMYWNNIGKLTLTITRHSKYPYQRGKCATQTREYASFRQQSNVE